MVTKDYDKEHSKKIRRIVKIIFAIIIILLLIRSCASEFNWTIGKLFGTASNHEITEETDDVIILNKELKFETSEAKTYLGSGDYKVGYTYNQINPTEFTCTTSDASIATCHVKDGYVVINPKKVGTVIIYIQTKTNNKVYKASMKLTVEDIKRMLSLSSNNGTIVLSKTNKKIVTYNLLNITGTTTATSNDESLATVKVTNGAITITAKKIGNCKITVSVVDKNTNKTFKVVYNLKIVNDLTDQENESNKPTIDKFDNNYLSLITVSSGTLSPKFNKNITNYNVSVENNIDKVNVTVKKENSKATIKYIYNGKKITDLNNLALNIGNNILVVEVKAENGIKRLYTLIINRKQIESISNYLESLSVDGYTLTPSFNKETSFYEITVNYNDKEISLNYTKQNPESNVDVTINNNQVMDLSNINLNDGDNKLEIIVTDNRNIKRVYVINIHKPLRTIEFYENHYTTYIEQSPYHIGYKILEDGIEINEYELSDITVSINNFNGTYELHKGYITITPVTSDINKNISINITYNNKTATTELKVNTNTYYINSPAYEYDIAYVNNSGKKNIIINNNILYGTITKTNITNGIRLTSVNGAYIDIIANNNLININYDSENSTNNSIVIKVETRNSGTSIITVSGNIFNNEIKKYNVRLNIINKYNVIIDANGGFFDSIIDKYTYLVTKTDEINLSKFTALKVDDEANCLFFKLDSFNTKKTGTGIKYNKSDVLTNFTSDLTLYAVYTETSSFEELKTSERLYLTEVNLFHNEEYYEKYNIDKIIYPKAKGAHVMSLTNSGTNKIKITGINLEEDTLCISNGKCLNIGYSIKSALNDNDPYTYFYGSSNDFKILNRDSNTVNTYGALTGYHTVNNISIDGLEIEVGETKEISILWKWVETDDELDTAIGTGYDTIGNLYTLTVSIDFERINNTCTRP